MRTTTGMMKIIRKNKHVDVLQFESLADDCNISHFITTRHGGVSEGNYTSFNLSAYCGDTPEAVYENRRRLCEALGIFPANLYVAFQTHGSEIRVIDQTHTDADKEQQIAGLKGVDALLTDVPGICVAVTTADCVPVILYAPEKRVVGVVHAGWRGTLGRITKKTIEAMTRSFAVSPANILAGIGPSIGQDAFETSRDVLAAFIESGVDSSLICNYDRQSGNPHIDRSFVRGLANIFRSSNGSSCSVNHILALRHELQLGAVYKLIIKSSLSVSPKLPNQISFI